MSDKDKETIKELKIQLALEKEHIAQLEKLLNHNPDTGLLQKHVLIQRMRKMILVGGSPFAFAIIRLDRNYQRIRHTRDRMRVLLYITSERIKEVVGEENLYQSDRSDEFLVIMKDMGHEKQIQNWMDQIRMRIQQYHNPPASDITFSCHMGVAIYPNHANTLEELLVNAEIALGIYEEKRDHGFIYSHELGKVYHKKEELEMVLIRSIRDNFQGFHMVFQPLMNRDGTLIGAEALLRWDAPGYGSVSPTEFIPLAEDSGQILFLGRWVLYHAMRQLSLWIDKYNSSMYMSINVSPVQLQASNFVSIVNDTLSSLKLSGESVHLEITEGSIMEDTNEMIERLTALKDLKIKIMLDDFGTGYSSLSFLNQLPIDTLKIAKEFIDDFPGNQKSIETVKAILSLARNFGFHTLAEGVEKQEQLDALRKEGCDYIQGFYYSTPIDAVEFEEQYLSEK